MRFLVLVLLLACCAMAQGQLVVGGKEFSRAVQETGARGEWVVYPEGAPQNEGTRRWLTRKVLVEIGADVKVANLQKVQGVVGSTLRGKYAVVEFSGAPDVAIRGADRLREVSGVKSAEPMLARQLYRRFVPNDPLFAYQTGTPGYQWHLKNTGQNNGEAGMDVNVVPTWDLYKGAGVSIGIVDDGLEVSHPDLVANVNTLIDYDFNGQDDDPSPGEDDFHGTACAGVAAARGNNGIGISGVAPEATLVGMRLISAPTTDLEEADAFLHQKDAVHIKSNSWGPYDGAYGFGGPGPLSLAAMQEAATTGRGGKGTVFLWAAGNGNGNGDDSNYDGWANSPYAIAVSAINEKGRQSWYSEPGSNILVCAPSNGGKQGITTTDITSVNGYNVGESTPEFPDYTDTNYTNTFGGTSSATPAVAGVVALMLQANSNLTYRDVQEILVRTAVKNDEFDGDWVQNGAGYHFNVKYGAGSVNALAATNMAQTWTNVPALQTHTLTANGVNLAVPDFDEDGITHTFNVAPANSLRLEHVTVKVKAVHPSMGNLEWRLLSPSGVSARLARARFNDTESDLEWTFMATHFWGERSEGNWKLQVIDRTIDDVGTLVDAEITFQGTPPVGGLPVPVLTSSWIISGREGWPVNHRMTASNSPTSYDVWRYGSSSPGLPTGLTLNPSTGLITGTPTETGLWEGYQYATNATGEGSEYTYFYILAADPTLSTAVEQPTTLKIVPFGFGDPFLQTTVTDDGVDAIRTDTVEDEEYSGIEFTVNGPAKIEFRWKVSSEKNFDYMVFTVDGYLRGLDSGEVDWKTVTTYVGPGAHNVDIYYFKDQAVSKGQDAGWIDKLVITPTTSAPVVETEEIEAYKGIYFRHQLTATNSPTSYAIGASSALPVGLTLHPETGLIYGSTPTAGSFPVTVEATNSFGTGTKTITINVGTVEEGLAAVVDAPAMTFSSTGDLPWVPQWLYARDGEDAARSGEIDNNQSSIMTTEVSGPCKLTFYWGVSSEADYDFLRFSINGIEQEAISGEVGWTRKSFLLPAGTHVLKWEYEKDEFTKSGLDSGFVDLLATHSDADGDGVHSDLEEHFGTSDSDRNQFPVTTVSKLSSGATVAFGSVSGESYLIEYSDDLNKWNATVVEATAATTTWTDTAAANKPRRFYRVVIP